MVENVHRWWDYFIERPGGGRRSSSGGAKIIFSDTNTHFRGAENYRRSGDEMAQPMSWRSLVTNVNEEVGKHNPLIGRTEELDRIMQILCRRDKNNPILIGEPGVGKTAIVYGLVERMIKGEKPDPNESHQIQAAHRLRSRSH